MFYLNKIVGWMLSPLGLAFLGLAAGWAWRHWAIGGRVRWLGTAVGIFAVAQLWFFSCGFATRWIGLPLEGGEDGIWDKEEGRRKKEKVWIEEEGISGEGRSCEVGKVDAVVLLGGGIGTHKQCGRPEIFGGADRAWMAAKCWKRLSGGDCGSDVMVTVSGGGARGEVAFLSDMGVDTNCVVMVEGARNTAEEARMIRERLPAHPRIVLVTSAWHMPRARMLFERVGFDVVPAPTDYEMHYAVECQYQPSDFFPSCEALVRNSYAVKEWIARFCYGLVLR